MDALIEKLVIEIKKDTRYLSFRICEEKLQEAHIQKKLILYHQAKEKLQELKKYESYIDTTMQEQEVRRLKKELSQEAIIQEYYHAYHEINELLDNVTALVFKDISEEVIVSRYQI